MPFTGTGLSLRPGVLDDGMLVALALLLDSCVGDTDPSTFFFGDLSVWVSFGSTFSLRLGVTGRIGDRRLGEARRGELLLTGEVLRVDPDP